MLLLLIIWFLIFLALYIWGYSLLNFLNRLIPHTEINKDKSFELSFFTGLLSVSVISGYLSVIIPVGYIVLIIFFLISFVLFLINFRGISFGIKGLFDSISSLGTLKIFFLLFLIFFILTAVVQKITLGDTESYHAQTIQWIRKYSVVPGLGNIHGRLAFNSMFFVISALFTFQINDILIFPLNGLCFIVLLIRLFILSDRYTISEITWKSLFYPLVLIISFLILVPDLNSSSPDIMCTILIIFTLISLLEFHGDVLNHSLDFIILINLLVFSCIAFKLSSVFIVFTLVLLFDIKAFKTSILFLIIGMLVLLPFLIRNYYLSGYLIYPFPGIDIFNLDWKIPLWKVMEEKLSIESWAKISVLPYTEVMKMKIHEWIVPWFYSLSLIFRIIISINVLSAFTFAIMLIKKDYFLAKLQLIIIINLVFWFLMAPDPRFGYGFLIIGNSITLGYLIHLSKVFKFPRFSLVLKVSLACLLFIVLFKRINFPLETIKDPSLWLVSAPFGTVETNTYYSDFQYRVPVPGGGCYNVEIPCTPYPLTDIVLRGKSLQDGFKVEKGNY